MPEKIEYEVFKDFCVNAGLNDVSEDEYQEYYVGKPGSPSTAIRRITNARRRIERDADRVMETYTGYPLGGRDTVGRNRPLEQAKGQYITFLTDGGELMEFSQFGTFKGEHGRKCEIEVEMTTREYQGQEYENRVIRSVKILDGRVTVSKIKKAGIGIDDVESSMLYKPIIVVGEAGEMWDAEYQWEDDQKTDPYPLYFNEQFCGTFTMKNGEEQSVRSRVKPTKYARGLFLLADFDEIAKMDDAVEMSTAFCGKQIAVVGTLASYNLGTQRTWATVNTTAIIDISGEKEPELQQSTLDAPPGQDRASGSGESESEEQSAPVVPLVPADENGSPADDAAEEAVQNAPRTTPSEVAQKVAALKESVREALIGLGEDADPQSVRALVEIPDAIEDTVLSVVIRKVRAEMAESEEQSAPPSDDGEGTQGKVVVPKIKVSDAIVQGVFNLVSDARRFKPDGIGMGTLPTLAEKKGIPSECLEPALKKLVDEGRVCIEDEKVKVA